MSKYNPDDVETAKKEVAEDRSSETESEILAHELEHVILSKKYISN
jgi:hypothetical protein